IATATHPAVTNAPYTVDAALLVKVAEGALYPTPALRGNVPENSGRRLSKVPYSIDISTSNILCVDV
ncbi:MAG: hypothetical protein WBE94_22200, partial [Pseudolabrys sp.]